MKLDFQNQQIIQCTKCPRLIRYCKKIALEKRKQFLDDSYWGKPVPGFGDPKAKLLVVGLAPAAHGANRTGRMFTGDNSGVWLYRALHKAGFANQAEASSVQDGLKLKNAWVCSSVRCAPPENKPTLQEFKNCSGYLENEIKILLHRSQKKPVVILALGQLALRSVLKALEYPQVSKIKFSHGLEVKISNHVTLLVSYHPSQHNTFTGRLTGSMFDAVFNRAKKVLIS